MELYDKKYVYFEWDDILEGKKCFLANNPTDLKMNVNCGCTDCYGEVEQKSDKNFPFRLKNSKSWNNEGCFIYYDPNYEVKKAWIEGKQIQVKYYLYSEWEDVCEKFSSEKDFKKLNWDKNEWRIKPTEEIKYVTIRTLSLVGVNGIIIDILDEAPKSYIFKGSKEECENLMNSINCIDLNCSECKNPSCNSCKKILDIIKVMNAWHNGLKTTRRMTNKELARWLSEGNGEIVFNLDALCTTVYHEYDYTRYRADEEVPSNIKIRKWNSDKWEEPLIEVK